MASISLMVNWSVGVDTQLSVTELQQPLNTLEMIGPVLFVGNVVINRPPQKLISVMNFVITG